MMKKRLMIALCCLVLLVQLLPIVPLAETTGAETGISGTSLLGTTVANWTKHIGFVPTTNGEPAQFASDKIVGTDGTIKDIWEGFGDEVEMGKSDHRE